MASVLFLGASGQVGGRNFPELILSSVDLIDQLGAFLPVFRQKYPDIPITAFLRSSELDTALHNLGKTTVVHGTFDEHDKLESLSATHSIIIDCAASFQPLVSEAILRGINRTETSRKPILLHLSGAGNFVDHSKTGDYIPQAHPFNDANPDQVRKIDATYTPNGGTDEIILKAAAKGQVNAFFVTPTGIYGNSTNHIGRSVGAAAASAAGVWVKWSLDNVEALGFSPYIGSGTAEWRVVFVDDVVDLTMLVFQKALDTWDSYQPEDVYRHYYIAAGEKLQQKPIAEAFADLVFRRGKIPAPVAKAVPYEKAGKLAG